MKQTVKKKIKHVSIIWGQKVSDDKPAKGTTSQVSVPIPSRKGNEKRRSVSLASMTLNKVIWNLQKKGRMEQ